MTNQELLWKYAEGNCSPAELAAVEKLIASDPSLQTELDNILEVQSVLMTMESEAPSLRFTQNVLDALPEIYPSEVVEPLVKPIWKKAFWLAVAALIIGVTLMPHSVSPTESVLSPYIDQVMGGINQAVGQVPNVVMQYFVLTLLSVGLLMLMDKIFMKKGHGVLMV